MTQVMVGSLIRANASCISCIPAWRYSLDSMQITALSASTNVNIQDPGRHARAWRAFVVIMKGMCVYHHLHLRRRGKLLKRAISTSPDKGVVQLAARGAVSRKCFDWYMY